MSERRVGMKKHGYFQLAREEVLSLAEEYGSPLLVLSLQQVEANYKRLRRYLPRVRVHYAIKANPHPEILRTMIKLGSSFDVASDGEIRLLNSMGVKGEKMIYANPMKTQGGLKACVECRVSRMTFDCKSELDKIAKVLPNATVLLRLRIDNSSAHVYLNKNKNYDVIQPKQGLTASMRKNRLGLDCGIGLDIWRITVDFRYILMQDIYKYQYQNTETSEWKNVNFLVSTFNISIGYTIWGNNMPSSKKQKYNPDAYDFFNKDRR